MTLTQIILITVRRRGPADFAEADCVRHLPGSGCPAEAPAGACMKDGADACVKSKKCRVAQRQVFWQCVIACLCKLCVC